jgi:hypothetical protein
MTGSKGMQTGIIRGRQEFKSGNRRISDSILSPIILLKFKAAQNVDRVNVLLADVLVYGLFCTTRLA